MFSDFLNFHKISQGVYILFWVIFLRHIPNKSWISSKALKRTSDQELGAWSFFCLWLLTEALSLLWSEPVIGYCELCSARCFCALSGTFYWIDLCTFHLIYKSYFVIIQLIMPIRATRFNILWFNLQYGESCNYADAVTMTGYLNIQIF